MYAEGILTKGGKKRIILPKFERKREYVSHLPIKGDVFMTYPESLAWLHSMPRLHREPTLARIRRLLSFLGDPHKALEGRFLHVTGTNGKGSACAFLTSSLRCAGYRVGRFISPFIMEFRERMEIDGERISEEEVCALTERLKAAAERYQTETGELPLEFELVTAMGFLWFAEKACDLVVLEVGIGGMYDPTNVVTPLVSLIMRVDYDHTEILGPALADIARQKAGIIKPGRPCVVYPENAQEVFTVIHEKCTETGSDMIVPDTALVSVGDTSPGYLSFTYRGISYTMHLSGLYQIRNALCAIEALSLLPSLGFPISAEQIRKGLSEAHFPARFEVLSKEPYVILDGAHNASGMAVLRESVDRYFPEQPLLFLCGMLRDKTPGEALSAMLLPDRVRYAACITPPTPRAMDASALAGIFRENGIPADGYQDIQTALEALRAKDPDGKLPVICFGSLYSAGDIRRAFSKFEEN